MAQTINTAVYSEKYFVVILLLLSYVLSSAPRYVRSWRQEESPAKKAATTPLREIKKAVNIYALQPYKKIWQQLQPRMEFAQLMP